MERDSLSPPQITSYISVLLKQIICFPTYLKHLLCYILNFQAFRIDSAHWSGCYITDKIKSTVAFYTLTYDTVSYQIIVKISEKQQYKQYKESEVFKMKS